MIDPRLQHGLAKSAAAPEQAVEIYIDQVQPVLVRQRLRQRLRSGDASFADENVDAAFILEHPRCGGVDLRRIRHVHFDEVGLVALGRHR